jgi:hypothetical protein
MFLDSFVLPGVQLYSLQKGPPAAELKATPNAPIIDLGPKLEDFADAAAVVAELDLIIMTDSALAHLGGAMGRPVSLLLNTGPYWIWKTEGRNPAWYESITAFRSGVWNNWTSVFDEASASVSSELVAAENIGGKHDS